MNNVEYFQNRQSSPVTLTALEKINNRLWIDRICSPIEQSYIKTALPSALKQVNMKTMVDTIKRVMTILV